LFVAGVVIAFWPLGEYAYGLWAQHEQHTEWQRAADASSSDDEDQTAAAATDNDTGSKSSTDSTTPVDEAGAKNPHKAGSLKTHRHLLPTRLIIPAIKLDAVLVEGVGDRQLRLGPGHDPASALPGERGDCVIAAHRNAYGWWFYRLNQLPPGAKIELRTPHKTYIYQLAYSQTVHILDNYVLQPPLESDAAPRLTLYTCTLPRSDFRLVAVANLISSKTT
jgi:LPXTG-site transpeptidase (sortase) family protein